MANMKDVAKLANVSITTVYRVIHKNGYVKEETKNAINDAIKKLDYYPNNVGRSLNKNSLNIIAVIAPVGSMGQVEADPFYLSILSGIENELIDSGIDILISTQRPKYIDNEIILDYCKPYLERKADGIIILNGSLSERDLEIIRGKKVPVCMVSELYDFPYMDYVDIDNYKEFKLLLNKIYNQGHRKISFGGLPENSGSINLRFKAYLDFHKEKGLEVKNEYILDTKMYSRSGKKLIQKYLKLEDKPTVIAFSTDTLAVEAYMEAINQGINVPQELSLTGFDGTNISQFMNPSLTTIKQPLFQMGKKAANVLLKRIENPDLPFKKFMFDSELKVGESLQDINPQK